MNPSFLAKLELELTATTPDYYVKEVDIESINNSMDRILSHIKTNVVITGSDGSGGGSSSGGGDDGDDDNKPGGGTGSGGSGPGNHPGAKPGNGSHNITGGEVAGDKSINGDDALEIVEKLEDNIVNDYSTNKEGAEKAMEMASGSTVVYNPETGETTVYIWYEGDKEKILLWNYGVVNDVPFIYCIAFRSDGQTKTIKVYTSEDLWQNSLNGWNSFNDRITNKDETVISPITGNEYHIVAEDRTRVGDWWNTQWLQFAITNCESEITWEWTADLGLTISSIDKDFFDSDGLRDKSDNGELIAPDDGGGSSGGGSDEDEDDEHYHVDNAQTADGGLLTDEELAEIEKEVKKAAKEAEKKAREEGKTEEEVQQAKKEAAQQKADELVLSGIKQQFRNGIMSNVVADNSLVLFIRPRKKAGEGDGGGDGEGDGDGSGDGSGDDEEDYFPRDEASERLEEIADLVDEIYDNYEKMPDELFQEYVESLDTGEEKAQEVLDSLGLDGTEDDEKLKAVAQEKAQKLVDAINNGDNKSDDLVINDILKELDKAKKDRNGWCIGLRYAIYGVIKIIGDLGIDMNNILYSTGIATVCAAYFTTGCMHIAVHVGGAAIVAVGTSLVLTAVQNIPTGMQLIQKGTTSYNPVDQAQGWADGISALYANGMINSLVVGTMVGSPSPIPLVGSGTQTQIQHSSMKILIMIPVLAAMIMLQVAAVASMITKQQIAFDAILDALGCKDGNDLLALFASIGIKLSLITTIAQTMESTAGSQGTGLIIPFGP